jgi:hypothetical protein
MGSLIILLEGAHSLAFDHFNQIRHDFRGGVFGQSIFVVLNLSIALSLCLDD